MAYDGHVYPEWSGLNDSDPSMDLDAALKSAINSVRHVWKHESRASREVLARHITGSECIGLLYALEGALARLSTPTTKPRSAE